ncbi:MAG: hypothetical protein K2X50_02870 [Gammaproteobacteria bacterium]|nr:hypothetical protein [Gammaproteobacteria bacterium]
MNQLINHQDPHHFDYSGGKVWRFFAGGDLNVDLLLTMKYKLRNEFAIITKHDELAMIEQRSYNAHNQYFR